MAQHTPGPWRVDDEGETSCAVRAVEDSAFIADCCDGFYNDDGEYIRAATVEANARLIAAAPDLLAALREIAGVVEKRGYTQRAAAIMAGMADAAIAKAEAA